MGDGTITSEPVREAVGVLPYEGSFRAAVDELLMSGFDRSGLIVVAVRRSVEREFGAMREDAADLEDEPEAPVTGYVGCDSRPEEKVAVVGGLPLWVRSADRDVHVHDVVHARPDFSRGVSYDLSLTNKIEGAAR